MSLSARMFFIGIVTSITTGSVLAAPPPEWTCGAGFYDSDDGCDCDCGAYDPDCADPNATLYRCPGDAVGCNVDGECRVVPPEWTCNDAYYDDNAGCDCGCGALDPDCERAGQTLYGCATGAVGCNVDGECRTPPASWGCSKSYYDARDGCDCGCGAYDPDCAVDGQNLIGCAPGATGCSLSGTCLSIPAGWSCLASHYNTADGCDCGCGAYDPDCGLAGQTLYGCDPGATGCSLDGECEIVPSSWTCPDSWFGAGDGCDCNCGAQDADCTPGASLYGCPQGSTGCVDGSCVTPSGPPPSWFCSASHYDSDDGCDCGCGAPDPDCATPGSGLYGCPQGSAGCSAGGTCLPPTQGPPSTWTCGVIFYGRGDGCDCGCGAPDPDCTIPGQTLYGCPQHATGCNGAGACVVPGPMVPSSWTCATASYGSDDGCHCDCGAPDPDCADALAPVVGCPGNATGCSVDGECVIPSCVPTCGSAVCGGDGCGGSCGACDDGKVCVGGACLSGVPPSTWVCPGAYYDAGDGCDCNCGAYDPDCDAPQAALYGCTQGAVDCDASGRCVNDDDPLALWSCAESHYDQSDGCDCDCGTYDPDCDILGAPLFGCPQGATGCNAAGKCTGTTTPPPAGWTCPAARFAAGDGCDCGCGVRDADCNDEDAPLFGCPQDALGCSIAGTCIVSGCTPSCANRQCGPDGCGGSCGACGSGTTCNTLGVCVAGGPPPEWTCAAASYGNGIACQCECGSSDPDCADVTLPLTGCETNALGCDGTGSCVYPGTCAPSCGERECGPDGCGGVCGTCDETTFCSAEGACLPRVIGGDGDGDDDDDDGTATVRSGCAACDVDGARGPSALVAIAVAALLRRRRPRGR